MLTRQYVTNNYYEDSYIVRVAREARHLYEERLAKTNKLYKELTDCIHQLQIREQDLLKYVSPYFQFNFFGFSSLIACFIFAYIPTKVSTHEALIFS